MNRTRIVIAAAVLLTLLGISPSYAQNAVNYVFATATAGSLTDMSSGTTTLVPANQDDVASAVNLIGFDFYFMGVRQDRFSANSNGTIRLGATAVGNTMYNPLGQASQALISACGSDQRTLITTGQVHFKVIGTAPNRVLVIEWLNMQSNFTAGGTADYTYQARLSEGTGAIEFVYGSMSMSTAGAADANSNSPQFGFSSSNVVGTVGSVTAAQSGTPAPTFDGTLALPANNLYVAGPIPVLTSVADGSRRTFSFTPPVPAAPTGLLFTGVTPIAMTLNWTDSASEVAYAIYRSTDGINYAFDGAAAANATSYNATGLLPSTNYFWQVYATSEGGLSTALAGSQMTSAPGVVVSTGAGGNWSDTATWVGGVVPTTNDNVTIADGAVVTIDTAAVALGVTVGTGGAAATLQYESAAARTLTVVFDVNIATNGVFQTATTGTVTTHGLSLGGNLANAGVLDFSTNANTAGGTITFTGATNTTLSGAGATTDVRQITMAKGTSPASTLEITAANFSAQGSTSGAPGWLASGAGTLKLSGTFTMSSNTFTAAAYTIGATGGFWLNNPNYTVNGQNGSPTLGGLLRVSQGTLNIGTSSGNSMGFSTGSTIVIEGGAVNAAGRFGVAASANVISYTQTGGTVTVCTVGNTSTTFASFDLGTAAGTVMAISNGTIVLQGRNTGASGPRDYRAPQPPVSPVNSMTGGTLQVGNAASGGAPLTYTIGGNIPNLLVTNTSANHIANTNTGNSFTLNITTQPGATLNYTASGFFIVRGPTVTNDGILTGGGTSRMYYFGAGPQTYTGTGTVTAPLNSFEVDNPAGLTVASTNPVITNRVILFTGGLTGANNITLGNGGATTGIIQIGNTTTPTGAGTFDVAPVFNLGTGGQVVSYLRTNGSRTTGPEINPTRILTSMSYDDNAPGRTLTVAGGDITLASAATALTLTNGRVVTGPNAIILSNATGTVTRTNGLIEGNHQLPYAATGSKTFHLGTATGYAPVAVNVTVGAPGDVRVGEYAGPAPGLGIGASVPRHWSVDTNGMTADVTFRYLDPADLAGITEANLNLFLDDGGTPSGWSATAGTLDTGLDTMTRTGAVFDDLFALAEPGGNLSITKDDGVTTVTPGGSLTYTIVASNPGPSGVVGATVGDTIPAALTCSWTCIASAGSSCSGGSGAAINDLVNLLAGGTATYTVNCTVSLSATGTISNTATITAPVGFSDGDLANNSEDDIDNVVAPQADLSITVTNGVVGVNSPGTTTYTIVATNAGPDTAALANVSDAFDPSLSCSTTCVATGGGTCTAGPITTSINDAVSLPMGATLTYTAVCNISATAPASLFNTAVIIPAGITVDPNLANNFQTDKDPVTSLLIFVDGFESGDTSEWSLTVLTVAGNVSLTLPEGIGAGGTLSDRLPAASFAAVVIGRGTDDRGVELFSIEARRASAGAALEIRLTDAVRATGSRWEIAESTLAFVELRSSAIAERGFDAAYLLLDGRIALSLTGVSALDESEAVGIWRFGSAAND